MVYEHTLCTEQCHSFLLIVQAILSTISAALSDLAGKVGAIVTAGGGVLSHGGIVAREYGIPGVVGVGPDLHRVVVPGALLRVDGSSVCCY